MKKTKKAVLEANGWRLGSAADFLELSPAEAAFVETKLALSSSLRARRNAEGLSQEALAKRLHSSQSRVAKMEAADPTVSVDLLLRALFALGARPRDVASSLVKRRRVVAPRGGQRPPVRRDSSSLPAFDVPADTKALAAEMVREALEDAG
jgi:transcriptional regulator with XRE-family HTH domain